MPVTAVTADPEQLTMTLTGDFAAPVERLWNAFTDPAQLERFWGPPTWPARFSEFDFTVGGRARYAMSGPNGERSSGAWEFIAINEPHGFEVLDSFVDDDGAPIDGMPAMRMVFSFDPTDEGSRLTTVSHFTSVEALEQVVAMGAIEGSTFAMNQLDLVLTSLREYAAGKGTQTELLGENMVRITRLIEGPRELVWRAHVEADLIRQWMLGPDGWRMTKCEPAAATGDTYRWGWAPNEGVEGEAFGFDGEALLVEEPRRMVTTERMTGTDYPPTTNDISFDEEDGATLVTTVITYPDAATREMVLATGMTEGMEASFARLERVLA